MLEKDDAGEWHYTDPAQEAMVFELAWFLGRDLTGFDVLLQDAQAWQRHENVRACLQQCRTELFDKFTRRYSDNESIEDALNLYWERFTRARMQITGKALETKDRKYRAGQKDKAQQPRATLETDDGRGTKTALVSRAHRMAGVDAGTPEVWSHLHGLLKSLGMAPVEDGAKETRTLNAKDVNGKAVKFTFKGVQTMLKEIRKAPPVRGRPRKKPA